MKNAPVDAASSINLLTQEEKHPKLFLKESAVRKFGIVFILLQLIAFGLVFSLNFTTGQKLDTVKKEIGDATQVTQTLQGVTNNVMKAKGKLSTYEKVKTNYLEMEQRLQKISALLPSRVSLTTLNINTQGVVVLSGFSSDPHAGYQFYQVLSDEDGIENLRLNSVEAEVNGYRFDMNFVVGAVGT